MQYEKVDSLTLTDGREFDVYTRVGESEFTTDMRLWFLYQPDDYDETATPIAILTHWPATEEEVLSELDRVEKIPSPAVSLMVVDTWMEE